MLKVKSIITTIVLAIIMTMSVHACWVHLSVDELFSKSDIILIGTVQYKSSKNIFSKYNVWNVETHYYLKGDIQNKHLVVATPDDKTNLHYDLNEWGNLVLLFLRVDNRNYTPLSPQGVVPVSVKEDILGKKNISSGKELTKFLEIIDPKSEDEEKSDIQNIIKGLDLITINENDESNNININSYLFVGCLVLLSIIFVNKFINK